MRNVLKICLVCACLQGGLPAANAASAPCFQPPPDSSEVGQLHQLSSLPLDINAVKARSVTRASAFFRDKTLAGLNIDVVRAGSETQISFTFNNPVDYEILINVTGLTGLPSADPANRVYLLRYRYCVRGGLLLAAPEPSKDEVKAAHDALELLGALLDSNRVLPAVRVAEIK